MQERDVTAHQPGFYVTVQALLNNEKIPKQIPHFICPNVNLELRVEWRLFCNHLYRTQEIVFWEYCGWRNEIIGNNAEYQRIKNYIIGNPKKWNDDALNA